MEAKPPSIRIATPRTGLDAPIVKAPQPKTPAAKIPADVLVDAPSEKKEPQTALIPGKDELRLECNAIEKLCASYTPPSEEREICKRVLAYINGSPGTKQERANALFAALDKRGITYARLVDEIEDGKARDAFLRETVPLTTPAAHASVIDVLSEGWTWRYLSLFNAFSGDREALQSVGAEVARLPNALGALFEACKASKISFETLFDAVPSDRREAFTLMAAKQLSLDDKVHAVLQLMKGATPAAKERAMTLILESLEVPERKVFVSLVESRGKAMYAELNDEIDARGRAFLQSAFLSPKSLAELRAAKLPVFEADFDAARATTLLQPFETALTRSRELKESEQATVTEMSAHRTVLDRTIADIDALILTQTKTKQNAEALGQKHQGSSAQDKLLREDTARIAAFADQQIETLQAARARALADQETLAAIERGLTQVTSDIAAAAAANKDVLDLGAKLLAQRQTLVQSAAKNPALAPKLIDTSALENQLQSLRERCDAVRKVEEDARALRESNPAAYDAILKRGLLDALGGELQSLTEQAKPLKLAIERAHVAKRAAVEGSAVEALAETRDLAALTEQLLEGAPLASPGGQSALDAHVAQLRAHCDALQDRLQSLQNDLSTAQADLALEKKKPRTVKEELRLAKARITLAGVLPADGGKRIAPKDLIAALREARVQTAQQIILVEDRHALLVSAVNTRLALLGLAEIQGTDEAALLEGTQRLAAALGLPAPQVPEPDVPFVALAADVTELCQRAQERQHALYAMTSALLAQHFGIQTRPLPKPPIDSLALDAFLKANLHDVLTQLAGTVDLKLTSEDLACLSHATTLTEGMPEKLSPLMGELQRRLSNRQSLSYGEIDVLIALHGSHGPLTKQRLAELANDRSLPLSDRERVRMILAPPLSGVLGLSKPADVASLAELTELRSLVERLQHNGAETPSISVNVLSPTILQDVKRLHTELTSSNDTELLAVLQSIFGKLGARERAALIEAFNATTKGKHRFEAMLADKMGGHELGWALSLVLGASVPERAAMHIAQDHGGSFAEQDKAFKSIISAEMERIRSLDEDIHWLYELYGARPDSEDFTRSRVLIAQASTAWAQYALTRGKEPRERALTLLAEAQNLTDKMAAGTTYNLQKTDKLRGACERFVKDALNTVVAVGSFLVFKRAGMSWSASVIGTTVTTGYAAGVYSGAVQYINKGHIDTRELIADMRSGATTGLVTAFTMGASYVGAVRAVDVGAKYSKLIESSVRAKDIVAYIGRTGGGVVGSAAGTLVAAAGHGVTGDGKLAEQLIDGVAMNMLGGAATAFIIGPTLGALTKQAGGVVKGAAELAEEVAETAVSNGGLKAEDLMGVGINKLSQTPVTKRGDDAPRAPNVGAEETPIIATVLADVTLPREQRAKVERAVHAVIGNPPTVTHDDGWVRVLERVAQPDASYAEVVTLIDKSGTSTKQVTHFDAQGNKLSDIAVAPERLITEGHGREDDGLLVLRGDKISERTTRALVESLTTPATAPTSYVAMDEGSIRVFRRENVGGKETLTIFVIANKGPQSLREVSAALAKKDFLKAADDAGLIVSGVRVDASMIDKQGRLRPGIIGDVASKRGQKDSDVPRFLDAVATRMMGTDVVMDLSAPGDHAAVVEQCAKDDYARRAPPSDTQTALVGQHVQKKLQAAANDAFDRWIETSYGKGTRAQDELLDLMGNDGLDPKADHGALKAMHAALAKTDKSLAEALRSGVLDNRAFFEACLQPVHDRALTMLAGCEPSVTAKILTTIGSADPKTKAALLATLFEAKTRITNDKLVEHLTVIAKSAHPREALATYAATLDKLRDETRLAGPGVATILDITARAQKRAEAGELAVQVPRLSGARVKEAIDALCAMPSETRRKTLDEIAKAPPAEQAYLLGLLAARAEQKGTPTLSPPTADVPPYKATSRDHDIWFDALDPNGPLAKAHPEARDLLLDLVGNDLDKGLVNSKEAAALIYKTFAARGHKDPIAGYQDVQSLLRMMRVLLDQPNTDAKRLIENVSASGLVQYFTASCGPTSLQMLAAASHPLLALQLVAGGRQTAADWQRLKLQSNELGTEVREHEGGVIGAPALGADAEIAMPANQHQRIDGLSDASIKTTLDAMTQMLGQKDKLILKGADGWEQRGPIDEKAAHALEERLFDEVSNGGPRFIAVRYPSDGRHAMVATRAWTDAEGVRWYEIRNPGELQAERVRASDLHRAGYDPGTLDVFYGADFWPNTADTRRHVHQGEIETAPTSPYQGKWNGAGLHTWRGVQAMLARDGFTLTKLQEDPNTGVRRVLIERSGYDARRRQTVTSVSEKTLYPMGMTDAEVDAAGAKALRAALDKAPGTLLRGETFTAKVTVGIPPIELTISGAYKKEIDGSVTLTTHFPLRLDADLRRLPVDTK